MNIQNNCIKSKRAKRWCLISLIYINILFMLLLYYVLAISPKEVDAVRLSIAFSLSWLPLNVIFIILYLRVNNAKIKGIPKLFNSLNDYNRKKFVKYVLVDFVITILVVIMLFKGMTKPALFILFVSLFALICYWKKLVRESRETEVKPGGHL